MKKQSNRAANYFRSLGIKKGDKVMVVLRRQYHFWLSMLALCKIGAIAIPATDQLLAHDYEYRFEKAQVDVVLCTASAAAAGRAGTTLTPNSTASPPASRAPRTPLAARSLW